MKLAMVFSTAALLLLVSCQPAEQSSAANEAWVKANVEAIWNQGQLDKIDEIYTDDFVRNHPDSWEPQQVQGKKAFKEYVTAVRKRFPDFNVQIIEMISQGDVVAARWTATGTEAETQRPVSFNGMTFIHYTNGKASAEYLTWDTQSVAQQLQPSNQTSAKE